MTQANDSITVTPGSGATVATHLANSKEHQVMMLADATGHLAGTQEVHKLVVPPQAIASNKVHLDLFNATGSGKKLRVLSIKCIGELDTAVTGALSLQMFLTRTTAVGTGGTAASSESTSLTTATFVDYDPANAALPAQVTARVAPTGGATAGAVLGRLEFAPEETNTSMGYLASRLDFVPPQVHPYGLLTVPENTGLRIVQGPIASVGTMGFEIIFYTE